MLFDDPRSLCHRCNWDLEIGQPEHITRASEETDPRILLKKSKKKKEKKRRRREINKENSGPNTIQWRSTGRQSYFTDARASFALPLMD